MPCGAAIGRPRDTAAMTKMIFSIKGARLIHEALA